MPRFSVPVSEQVMNVIQGVCNQYSVTQRELADVMFAPQLFTLTVDQEETLKTLGKDRKMSAEVKKAIDVLSTLSDEQIAAILEARNREAKQDGRDDPV